MEIHNISCSPKYFLTDNTIGVNITFGIDKEEITISVNKQLRKLNY